MPRQSMRNFFEFRPNFWSVFVLDSKRVRRALKKNPVSAIWGQTFTSDHWKWPCPAHFRSRADSTPDIKFRFQDWLQKFFRLSFEWAIWRLPVREKTRFKELITSWPLIGSFLLHWVSETENFGPIFLIVRWISFFVELDERSRMRVLGAKSVF